jgi:signal peptidase I
MIKERLGRRWKSLRRHPLRTTLRSVCTIGVLIGTIYCMWPSALGGPVQLVVVSGNSMEPTYHNKDLLYVRTDRSIRVGEPAVYRMKSASGDNEVMIVHRITDRDNNGNYVFRGDNRSNNDAQPIAPDDVIGVPILNVGPLPTRFLAAMPLYGTLLLGVWITWMLWPRKQKVTTNSAATLGEIDETETISAERLQVIGGQLKIPDVVPTKESMPLSETA